MLPVLQFGAPTASLFCPQLDPCYRDPARIEARMFSTIRRQYKAPVTQTKKGTKPKKWSWYDVRPREKKRKGKKKRDRKVKVEDSRLGIPFRGPGSNGTVFFCFFFTAEKQDQELRTNTQKATTKKKLQLTVFFTLMCSKRRHQPAYQI